VLTLRDRDGAERLNARNSVGHREVSIDLTQPISLAIDLRFSTQTGQPRHFGAPPASSRPFAVPGFSGSVEHGASCNCQTLTLIPHCNGTHTECVGHLTREPADAYSIAPFGLLPALLLSVEPTNAESGGESTEPTPQPGDSLITRSAIVESWAKAKASSNTNTDTAEQFAPTALVIRTLPNNPDKQHLDYTDQTPPYLSREAASLLVERGIEHLVVDLPSIDRSHDEGRLTAHRVFFGLPRGSSTLTQATRPRSTVTELAYIPDTAADGPYLLELQVPALGGDAVPSRPLLYRLLSG
jgi:arylformamidase